ncbi:hypothetical protein [Paludibaculum fermentans]|uniref:IPT/TIG domain-containing protein n=1 Tax=Paludibaculum fermentans TaxID=1473598 RepID=A0A7S7NWZ1_PALFE|nr:hypothetical protein [Paludibaculum fermentans]QOY91294.1 hypothetical protein IRI77_15500 [Paludibaculum fermentans]
MLRHCLWILAGTSLLAQQPPVVTADAVRNGASRIAPGLPGSGLHPGSRAVIGGLRLSPGSVRVEVGGQVAPMLRSAPEELEVALPFRLKPGVVPLSVTVDGRKSKPVSVVIGAASPGLYEPAKKAAVERGGLLSLVATGAPAVELWMGGVRVAVVRRSRGDGTDEVRARVPASVPLGCGVPVTAVGADGVPGNTIAMAVSEKGQPCPADAWTSALGRPGRTGLIVLSRSYQGARATDEGAALFTVRGEEASWPSLLPGSCGLYRADEGFDPRGSILAQMTGRVPGEGLDAGARITIANGPQARALALRSPGFYTRTLDPLPNGPFLEGGRLLVQSMGGKAVAGLSFVLTMTPGFPAVLPAGDSVLGAAPLSLSWTGIGPDRLALVAVTASDAQNRAMVMALCVAAPEAGRFVVPAWVRAALPETSSATVSVASIPRAPDVTWKATGLDRGVAFTVQARHTVIALKR